MDSVSIATEATFTAAEAATEAGGAEAAVVEGLRSVVAAVVEGLRSVVAAVVESLGNGGSLAETLTSSEGNSLVGGSFGGSEFTAEVGLLTDELTLLETNDGGLAGTTWDGFAAAESLDASVGSAGSIKTSVDESTSEGVKSGTS